MEDIRSLLVVHSSPASESKSAHRARSDESRRPFQYPRYERGTGNRIFTDRELDIIDLIDDAYDALHNASTKPGYHNVYVWTRRLVQAGLDKEKARKIVLRLRQHALSRNPEDEDALIRELVIIAGSHWPPRVRGRKRTVVPVEEMQRTFQEYGIAAPIVIEGDATYMLILDHNRHEVARFWVRNGTEVHLRDAVEGLTAVEQPFPPA
jgi:hypothetical protein